MLSDLEIFRMASGMARHANARLAVVATNIAHVDTPNYRSKDIASFAEALRRAPRAPTLRQTRPQHLGGSAGAMDLTPREDRDAVKGLNGNTVSLETEMLRSAELGQQHETALAIYRSALKIVRGSLGPR